MLIFCPCIQHRNDKNLTILPLYIARRRREIFGNLNRLHKGFTLILERRRRENFDNLQENFENCRTFKPLF